MSENKQDSGADAPESKFNDETVWIGIQKKDADFIIETKGPNQYPHERLHEVIQKYRGEFGE